MREQYITRNILLSGGMQKETAIQLIKNAPIDPVKPIEFVLREHVKKRSNDANSYYWLRLGEIADQGWIGGKKFNSDIWHEYSKKNLMQEQIVTKNGDLRSKWVECPDGSMVVISTTNLEKKCFAEYITIVESWAAQELGVKFSSKGQYD